MEILLHLVSNPMDETALLCRVNLPSLAVQVPYIVLRQFNPYRTNVENRVSS